jgi:hypothetical protein
MAKNAFAPGLQVSSKQIVRKRRELPLAGHVLVNVGDSVSGDQIVARAELEGDLRIVRVAEALGISSEDLGRVAKVSLGERVTEGGIIAEMRGLWGLCRSTVTSPIAGTVEFISLSTGHVGVRAAPRVLELCAYISGQVVEVEPARSVTIETTATFAQGIFGVGGERIGRLVMLPISPSERVGESSIPAECSGAVLVGGHSPSSEALNLAAARGAVGFVTGSIDDAVLRSYIGYDLGVALTGDEAVPMSLIITEGFGSIPMSNRIVTTLTPVSGSKVSINGATQVRAGAQRPEVVVWTTAESSVSEADTSKALDVGARVRLIRVPYFGLRGTVSELPHELRQLETGAFARVLCARLDDGRDVVVPRANIELE